MGSSIAGRDALRSAGGVRCHIRTHQGHSRSTTRCATSATVAANRALSARERGRGTGCRVSLDTQGASSILLHSVRLECADRLRAQRRHTADAYTDALPQLLAREDFLRAVSALGEDERCECSPAGLKAAISSIDVLGLTADRNDLPASGSSNASRPGSPESPYARRHAEQVARDWADSRYPGRPAAFTETRRAKVKKLTDALAEDGVNLDDSLKVEPLKRVRRIR